MKSGIYCIENLKNGKKYIGQSRNIERRWSSHQSAFRRGHTGGSLLYRAMAKHGIESFEFRVLEYCSPKVIDERERFYIQELQSMSNQNGYNIESGGHMGEKISPLVSQRKRGKNNPMFGKKMSKEHKEILSVVSRGTNNKLQQSEVEKIKRALLGGATPTELSACYGVGVDTISKIGKCKNWSWVLPELNEALINMADKEKAERDLRIKEMYEQGMSANSITKDLHCDSRTVTQIVGTSRLKELQDRKALIAQDFKVGMTREELQEKYSVARSVVNTAVKDEWQKQRQDLAAEWTALRENGLLVKDIAEMYGVNRTTVTDNTQGFVKAKKCQSPHCFN